MEQENLAKEPEYAETLKAIKSIPKQYSKDLPHAFGFAQVRLCC
jgi:hypothetical protein